MPPSRTRRPSRHRRSLRLRWWWHRHPVLGWAGSVAVVVALVRLTGGISLPTGVSPGADPPRTAWVAVATQDLEVGRRVAATDITWEHRPAATVAGQAVDDPIGRTVVAPVLATEVLVAERIAPQGLSPTAARVPPGGRAVAVPPGLALPPVVPGDRVDVLVVSANGWGSSTVARAVPVLWVDEAAVTVAVPAASAAAVSDGLAAGLVTLALVGAEP